MKRLVLLFLLAVLSIQITWAAGLERCPHEAGAGVIASVAGEAAHAAHAHAHDGDGSVQGHAAGSGFDCGVFQVVALEPPAARAPPSLPAGATAHGDDDSGYASYFPPGLDRPKWRLAA